MKIHLGIVIFLVTVAFLIGVEEGQRFLGYPFFVNKNDYLDSGAKFFFSPSSHFFFRRNESFVLSQKEQELEEQGKLHQPPTEYSFICDSGAREIVVYLSDSELTAAPCHVTKMQFSPGGYIANQVRMPK